MKKLCLALVLAFSPAFGQGLVALVSGIPTNQSSNGFSRSITVPTVTGTQVDFPVLVSGTYTYLKTVSNGGKVRNVNGYDVLFGTNADCSSRLKWQIEAWSGSTGIVSYWVKIPSLGTGSVFYICYGKTSITTNQSDPTNVWSSDFLGVYHLSDNAATTTVLDSTANASNGTNQANTSGKSTTGKIALALNYSAGSDYTTATWGGLSNSRVYSFCGWINPQSGANSAIVRNTAQGTVFYVDSSQHVVADQGGAFLTGSATLTNGTFWRVCVTANGPALSGTTIYVNGVNDGNSGLTTGLWDTGANTFGGDPFGLNAGTLDEFRAFNVELSAGWAETDYLNQNDPASFYTIGSEVPL